MLSFNSNFPFNPNTKEIPFPFSSRRKLTLIHIHSAAYSVHVCEERGCAASLEWCQNTKSHADMKNSWRETMQEHIKNLIIMFSVCTAKYEFLLYFRVVDILNSHLHSM